jgi:cardiolipin synthase
MKITAKEFWSIPNILSYLRLLLIPCFLVVYLGAGTAQEYLASAGIVLISGLTDFADGFIARKFNMITQWGKVLDPIADKLTQAAIVFALMFKIPYMWILFIIFAVKETTMGICSLYFLRKKRKLDGAKWFGKLSTFVFYIILFLMIAFEIPQIWRNIMMCITGFFLMLAFVLYMRVYYHMWRAYKEDPPENK